MTDIDLVAATRAGDDAAFEQLYRRYHRRIASYIFGMVNDYGRAEDIAQDVFMSALRRMRETERPIAFKPWVYEIAKNACIDQFRRSRRAEEVSYDADGGLAMADQVKLVSPAATPDVAVEGKQQLDHLRGAFGGLSDVHHEILVMRELEGLSYREIGERLGMSRPSVESTLFRARRRLTEEYEELISGERCVRVQAIVAGAASGGLGVRDQRKLARHISHCQACRRHTHLAGLDTAALAPRDVRGKIAAFLPLPVFLRRRWGSEGDGVSAMAAQQGTTLAQWSAQVAQYVEPGVTGWVKAAAAAATIAVAGAGANHAADIGALTIGGGADRGAVMRDAADRDTRSSERRAAAATPAAGLPAGAPAVAPSRRKVSSDRRSGVGRPIAVKAPAVTAPPVQPASQPATEGEIDQVLRGLGQDGAQPPAGGPGTPAEEPTGGTPETLDEAVRQVPTAPPAVPGDTGASVPSAEQVTGAVTDATDTAGKTVTDLVGGG